MALSWLFLLMLGASSVSSARIAGFHMIGGSQYINTKLVLEELPGLREAMRYFKQIAFNTDRSFYCPKRTDHGYP